MSLTRIRRLATLALAALALAAAHRAHANNDNDDWSLGVIGGTFRVQPGTSYVRVQSMPAGTPGAIAGIQTGDFLYGAFGRSFDPTSTSTLTGYKGAVQDLAEAIERAESGNGLLPLMVLRPGTGGSEIDVQLSAAGSFGPSYPVGSTKYQQMYETGAAQIHALVDASANADFGYMSGWFGLILLSHPDWDKTSGSRPYRNSINKLRDRSMNYLNGRILTPVEANDPAYVDPFLENWDITASAIFLALYREKSGDTAVDAVVQRAADMLANRVQDYQQPPNDSGSAPTIIGLMGHGGVVGDYAHVGFAGLNIINAHTQAAFTMLERSGATLNATKWTSCWTRLVNTMTDNGGPDDGNVGYGWKQGGYDSSGRTAFTVFAMENRGGMTTAQQNSVNRMKAYLVRQWQRFQHTHAYTVGGVVGYQFALPYLPHRDQNFIRANQRYFYHFHRNPAGTIQYFGGRENNGGDGYLDLSRVALVNSAMAGAITSGNLPGFPAADSGRLFANIISPWTRWPSVEARRAEISGLSASFNVEIDNHLGTALNPGDYTALWSQLSGPGVVFFATPNAASTTMTFPGYGTYRVQLSASRNGYTLVEPIDLVVSSPDSGTTPQPPVVSSHPANLTVDAGAQVLFNVAVSGDGPFLFQWRRNGVSHWPASTSSSLTIASASVGAAGQYECVITNPAGSVTSNAAALTVNGGGSLVQGGLWREFYSGISGNDVQALLESPEFPYFPDSSGLITSAEAPKDVTDNYGQRWTGWLLPDTTGNHRFFIASDDASELWLSTDEQPANKVRIAALNGWTSSRAWSSGAQSALIPLTSGQRYYIEVRHKEGSGADHCAVAWQRPGALVPTNGSDPIPAPNLETLSGGIHVEVLPVNVQLLAPAAETVHIRPDHGILLEAAVFPADNGGEVSWSKESGPGTVTFDDENSLATGASFSAPGTYTLVCSVETDTIPAVTRVTVIVTDATATDWAGADMSSPRPGNGTVNPDGSVTVSGAGSDIYSTSDRCHFFYQPITGDFDVRARIASKAMASASGQHAAIMARESTAANSRTALITHESSSTVAFQYRTATGGSSTYRPISGQNLPLWTRLVRSGGNPATGTAGQTFSGYYSTDNGATWILRESYTFTTAMPQELLVGFGVSNASSTASTALNTAVFDNLSGFGGQDNIGPVIDPGTPQTIPFGVTATLSGSATDDGKPLAPGTLAYAWSQTSGSGTAGFADPSSASTTATFDLFGAYQLRFAVSDGEVTTFRETTVTVEETDVAPQWASDPVVAPNAVRELPYTGASLADHAGDLNPGDTLTFTRLTGPAWLSLASDGTLSGTPTAAEDGLNVFTVRVTDSTNLSTDATLHILVTGPQTEIALSSPAHNSFHAWNDTVPLVATVIPGENLVSAVEFYLGETLLATDTTAPYTHDWNNPPAGSHTLSAHAIHSAGLAASASITVNITPEHPIWNNPNGGSWPSTGNWMFETIANGTGVIADFSTLDLTASGTVSLDGARSIGGLRFADTTPSHNWTLATGTGGPLTLSHPIIPQIDVANQAATVSAVLAGTQGFVKSGGGDLVLSSAGTWTGITTVAGGMLEVQAKSGDVAYVVDSGATLRIGYNTGTGYSPSVTVHGSGTASSAGLHVLGGRTLMSNSGILLQTAPSTIRRYGSGTANLRGFDTNSPHHLRSYTAASGSLIDAAVNINTGTYGYKLQTDPGSATATGDLTIAGSFFGGGSGGLIKVGTGSLRLSGASTHSNGLQFRQGTVILSGGENRLPAASTVTLGNGSDSSRLVLEGINQTLARVAINGSGTTNAVVGGSATNATLTIHATTDHTHGGLLGGTGTHHNNLGLVKSGVATLAISGSHQYTGPTVVEEGTLLIDGTLSASPATAFGGGIIGGSGTLGSTLDIVGGTLAPGENGPATLTVGGALTLGALAKLDIDLDDWTGPPGSGHDQVVAASLDITAIAANPVTIRLRGTPANFDDQPRSFILIATTAGITGMTTDKFTIDTTELTGGSSEWQVAVSGNNLVLQYGSIPAGHPIWTNPTGGSWPSTGNWMFGSVADGTGVIADFSTLDLTVPATVNLDGARSIGGLRFADTTPSHNWTLHTGTGGPLTLSGPLTPQIDVANQAATVSAVLAGTQGFEKAGGGDLVLTGANHYTGLTRVSEGALQVTGNNGAKFYEVAAGASLELGYSTPTAAFGYGVNVSGEGSSSPSGLYLLGGNLFNLQSTLRLSGLSSTVRTTGAGNVTLAGWDINNTHLAVEATASGSVLASGIQYVPGSYGYVMNIAPGFNTDTGDLIVQGSFTGGTNANNTHYRKMGFGSLRIEGAGTATTPFQIHQGSVILAGGDNRLGGGSSMLLGFGADSGLLVLKGVNQTFAALTHQGTGADNRVIGGSATLSTLAIDNPTASTLAASLGGGGTHHDNLALTKSGAGRLTLSGTNTYVGSTTVTAGTLQLARQSALYNNTPANWTESNIVAQSGSTLAFNVGGAGEFTAADLDILKTLGSATGGFQTGARLGIDTSNAVGDFTYSAGIANPNSGANVLGLTKLGTGTLVISGSNTFTGSALVSAGTLQIDSKTTDVPYTVNQGATLRLGYSTGGGYANTNLKINGDGVDATTGLHLKGGTRYNASGQIELLTAPTTIRHFGTGLAGIGTFDINGNGISVSLAASGSVIDENIEMISRGYGISMTVASGASTATGDLVINGRLNVGNFGFYKRGTGSVLLNQAATASNTAVRIHGGKVIAGAANVIGANAALEISTGGLLDLNGFNQEAGSLSGAGSVINGGASFATLESNQTADATFSGVLGGATPAKNAFAFVKDGTNSLTLSGPNSYTGDTTLKDGILTLDQAYLADSSAVRVLTGGTLNLSHGQSDTVNALFVNNVQQPAGIYNSGNASFITGSGSLNVTTGGVGDPFSTWAAANGLDGSPGKQAGFNVDPDGDGIDNGLEWILGGNPLDGQSAALVTTTATASGGLTLAFTRNEDSIGNATLTVEYNATLANPWNSAIVGATSSGPDANGVTVTINTASTPDTVTINIPATNTSASKLFGRLKATQP